MASPTIARLSNHEPYSNLEVAPEPAPELLRHDPAANAPERHLALDSPEFVKQDWPLSPGSPSIRDLDDKRTLGSDAPETGALDGSFPRSPGVGSVDTETLKETAGSLDHHVGGARGANAQSKDPEEPQGKKRRGAIFWLLIALIALLVLGIALGVGLGVGLTRNSGSSSSSSSSSPPPPPPSASATSFPHGLQNDTSVSVIALSNGDKRLFFQETGGKIRESLFTNSTGNWSSNINDVVANNAKNSTPISAMLMNNTGTSTGSTGTNIYLFYIASNNQIASKVFVSGTWATRDNFSPGQSSTDKTFTSTNDSRALAITANTNSSAPGAAFVFYVAANGSAQCLNVTADEDSAGINANPGPSLPASIQGGHVLGLAAGDSSSGGQVRPQAGILTSNGTTWYSLYFTFFTNGSWSVPELQTILVPALPPNQQPSVPSTLTLADAYPISATNAPLPEATADPSKQSASYNESLIGDVNIAQVFVPTSNGKSTGYTLFGFWVNGTELAAYTTKNIGLSGAPKSPFPYSRLAGTTGGGTGAGSSDVYLFHQVNATSIAQDVYSTDGGFFETTFFNVDAGEQ